LRFLPGNIVVLGVVLVLLFLSVLVLVLLLLSLRAVAAPDGDPESHDDPPQIHNKNACAPKTAVGCAGRAKPDESPRTAPVSRLGKIFQAPASAGHEER